MIAGYLTKPTQGSLFRKQRDVIMGITPLTMEEHVGTNENSIDEECETVANQKPGKQRLCRCRILLKKNQKVQEEKEGRYHSLDSYPNERSSGKREDPLNEIK